MGTEHCTKQNVAASKAQVAHSPGCGLLARLNDRRARLEREKESLAFELAELDAMARADLGCGLVARVEPDGSLLINAGQLIPAAATAALRDLLCETLGAPEQYEDLAHVTTLTKEQAYELAGDLARRARETAGSHLTLAAITDAVEAAIFDALDHVGVVQADSTATSPATRQAGECSTTPCAKHPAAEAGTAGSAHDHRNRDAGLGLDLGDPRQDPEPFDEFTGAFPIHPSTLKSPLPSTR
jgi:hypothetical protein